MHETTSADIEGSDVTKLGSNLNSSKILDKNKKKSTEVAKRKGVESITGLMAVVRVVNVSYSRKEYKSRYTSA